MARTDAERLTKLLEIRDSIDDRIAEVVSKPRPTYTVDGQTFKWAEYLEVLNKQRDAVLAQIAAASASGGLTVTQVFTGT